MNDILKCNVGHPEPEGGWGCPECITIRYAKLSSKIIDLSDKLKAKSNSIDVAQYRIIDRNESYWIQNSEGEGMQVSNPAFHKLIDDFFRDNY